MVSLCALVVASNPLHIGNKLTFASHSSRCYNHYTTEKQSQSKTALSVQKYRYRCRMQPNPKRISKSREREIQLKIVESSQVKCSSFCPTNEIRHPEEVLCSVVSYYLEIECWLLKFYEPFLQLQ